MNPKYNPITEGPISSGILKFFFPIMLGSFFQTLYSTVDAIIVGQFVGTEALGAVGGSTGNIIALLVGFFVGLSSGASVVISQFYGARNHDQLHKAIHTSMALALALGLLFTVAGVLLAPRMAAAVGVTGKLYDFCVDYLRIYFGGILTLLLYNMGTGILRAVGDSRRPTYYLVAGCGLNIVLDLLFVGFFHWEIAGAAYATILSQFFSAILTLRPLLTTQDSYRLIPGKIRFYKRELGMIFRLGLPSGFQSTMYAISNLLIQTFINAFDINTIAAWSAFSKVDQVYWMCLGAMGVSVSTFIGQNFGAGRMDRVHKSVRSGILLSLGMSVLISSLVYFFGKYILQLFTSDTEVLAIGLQVLRFLSPLYFTFLFIEIYAAALRAMGDSFVPMLLTCFGVCVLRIVWCILSRSLWAGSLLHLIACYPVTWITTSTLFFVYYRYFLWKNKDRFPTLQTIS